MSANENKALARRFIDEVWNQGKLDVADELLAPGLINHQATGAFTTGRDIFKQFITEFRATHPDIAFTIEDMIAEGDEVATRVTIRGSRSSGVTWTGIGIIRVVDGQIAEQWANTDLARSVASQLSAGPS